ncbi:MAG: hypothetical protein J5X21_19155 [Candidatus Accumulibacter sp.]|nr:hypothetical protein [Candidatus Accumulibacter conexus]
MSAEVAGIKPRDIWAYISSGGLANDSEYSILTQFDVAETYHDEKWANKHGTIFSISDRYWSLDILFDKNKVYKGDQLRFSILSVFPSNSYSQKAIAELTQICFFEDAVLQLRARGLFGESEVYEDAHERVIFLRNGANMHFSRVAATADWVIDKVTSASTESEATRGLVRRLMKAISG